MECWKAEAEIQTAVYDLIGKYHPHLCLLDKGAVVVVFRELAGKSGGQVILGQAQKVSNINNALAEENYRFMLLIGADTWTNSLNLSQREALLDHLLCQCRCEEEENTGDIKCSIARPDITAFQENVDRYGLWFPREEELDSDGNPKPNSIKEALEAAEVVEPTESA